MAVIVLAGCKKDDGYQGTFVWTVASEMRMANGFGGIFPSFVTKESKGGDWRKYVGYIEGFDYESGYEYVIAVKVYEIKDPPMDGDRVRYVLKKVISKEKKDSEGLPQDARPLAER